MEVNDTFLTRFRCECILSVSSALPPVLTPVTQQKRKGKEMLP